MDEFFAPLEVKFAEAGAQTGQFTGYASGVGNADAHGDVILPRAFADSLAERKAQNRPIPMHVMHRQFGGDGLPVGVWQDLTEDDRGLRVQGKISGMNTDAGRLLYERVKDGALGGLSIGFSVRPGGSVMGKKAGEPKRTLKALNLHEISLVDEPSNAQTRVLEVKAALVEEVKASLLIGDTKKAADSVAAAMALHQMCMGGGDSPTVDERAQMMAHLQDAHEALTGRRMPMGMKGMPRTIREFEKFLRDGGFSNSEARALAERGFKSQSQPRDGERDQAKSQEAKKSAADELSEVLAGFQIPKLSR
jgi:HK97 family phage prohead protease